MKKKLPPHLFAAHPENLYFVTGVRDWWALSMFVLKLTLGGGVLLFLLTFFLSPSINEVRLSQMPHQTIMGKVTNQYTSEGRSGTNYYISYQFRVDDETYSRNQSVSGDTYRSIRIGSPILVTYAANDPTVSHLGDADFDESTVPRALITVLAAGVLVYVLINQPVVNWFRRRYFYRNGQLIIGEITSISASLESVSRRDGAFRRPSNSYTMMLKYSFRPSPERRLEDQVVIVRNDLVDRKLPVVGTPIAVAYIDDTQYMLI